MQPVTLSGTWWGSHIYGLQSYYRRRSLIVSTRSLGKGTLSKDAINFQVSPQVFSSFMKKKALKRLNVFFIILFYYYLFVWKTKALHQYGLHARQNDR